MIPKLLLVTRNPGKVREYSFLLKRAPFELTTLDAEGIEGDIEETGSTYHENAHLKVMGHAIDDRFLVIADDSGLEIDALDGAPGYLSAKFGGADISDSDRVNLVLSLLRGVAWEKRSARFRCIIAIAWKRKLVGFCEGTCYGIIDFEARGNLGFGYDPIFYVPEFGKTMGELTLEEKSQVSHRARAAEKAVSLLQQVHREIISQ